MTICRTMFWSLVFFVGISGSTLGCHNDTYYCEGGFCGDGDGQGGPQFQVCSSFCDRLVTCGVIGGADWSECQSACNEQYEKDPDATEAGCACVERDACRDASDYQCPGAPLPGGGNSSAASA